MCLLNLQSLPMPHFALHPVQKVWLFRIPGSGRAYRMSEDNGVETVVPLDRL